MRLLLLIAILLTTSELFFAQEATQLVIREYPEMKETPPQFFLLRGLSREHRHWGEDFISALKKQFPDAKYTFMDLPGAGDHHDQKSYLSVKKMANFLHEQHGDSLAAHKGNNILLATSLGGIVALEWIDSYPDDFGGIIMVSSSFKGICKGKERAQPKAKREMMSILLTGDMPKREQKLLNINSNHRADDEALLQQWIQIQEERPISRWTMVKQGIGGMLYRPKKKKVTIPVLILGSLEDRLVAPSCICKVGDWYKGEYAFHPDSGHGMPIDAPEWMMNVSADWWERQLAAHKKKQIVEQTVSR
ncbi:MAG: alpha/beta hydrolase [Bacteroidota bacterium]